MTRDTRREDNAARFGDIGSPATNEIQVELGGDWQCPCGELLTLDGAWLAAHWQEQLQRTCEKCGQLFLICAGEVRLSSKTGPWNQDDGPDYAEDDDEIDW